MSQEGTEYCSSKLYVSGKDLDPQVVTERLQIEPDRVRNAGAEGFSETTRSVWRKAIDKNRESWDVSAQIESWSELLSLRREQVASLQALGFEFEIDCFISHGAISLITLSRQLLADLADLRVGVSLGFYDKTGKV